MQTTVTHYTVNADRTTGEWHGEPSYCGTVNLADHLRQVDTDDKHFDTYEVHADPLAATSETRAITVIWTD